MEGLGRPMASHCSTTLVLVWLRTYSGFVTIRAPGEYRDLVVVFIVMEHFVGLKPEPCASQYPSILLLLLFLFVWVLLVVVVVAFLFWFFSCLLYFPIVCMVVGCLMSQQHASASQGRIFSDNCTCCHTEIEVSDQTFCLT